MFKKYFMKKLKEEFFPFNSVEEFEKKISLNFPSNKIIVKKKYGKEYIYVQQDSYTLFFIYSKKDLVILLLSNTYPDEIRLRASSKINIISSDKWESDNNDAIELINFFSDNSLNPIYVLNNSLGEPKNFKESFLTNPLFWFLVSRNRKKASTSHFKTRYLDNVIKYVINSLKNKQSIYNTNTDKQKEIIFNFTLKGLLNNNSRPYLYNDILNNRTAFFAPLYPELFSSVEYDENEWDAYFLTEIIPTFKEDFAIYYFNAILDEDIRFYILSQIGQNIVNQSSNKNKTEINGRSYHELTIINKVVKNLSYEKQEKLLEDLSDFFNEIFEENTLFKNTVDREVSTPLFYSSVFDDMLSGEIETF